jgi:hypothetical protein
VYDLYLSGTNSLSYEVSTQYATCICQGLIVYADTSYDILLVPDRYMSCIGPIPRMIDY